MGLPCGAAHLAENKNGVFENSIPKDAIAFTRNHYIPFQGFVNPFFKNFLAVKRGMAAWFGVLFGQTRLIRGVGRYG